MPSKDEVIRPVVEPRMEKPNVGPCALYRGADIAALCPIAEGARIGQVAGVCCPTVFFADDVIHLTTKNGVILLYQAVFTEGICT